MAKTLIDIDEELLAKAAMAFGTKAKKDTVNAALRDSVERKKRARRRGRLRRALGQGELSPMTAATFLIDNSALVRILRLPARAHWESPLTEGVIARCPVTEIEFLYSAGNTEEREQLVEDLDELFGRAPLDDRALTRAWTVQKELTAKGRHRSAGAVDLLIAATAELQGLTVLHYDNDFEAIASVTGQPTQWLAPRAVCDRLSPDRPVGVLPL